jgi:hypothetical protein
MTIGLFLICTGKYDRFLQPLIDSVEKHFFNGFHLNIYLYTDKEPSVSHSDRIEIKTFPIQHLPFPYPTLYRYQYFHSRRHEISEDDLLVFYSDVDMKFVSDVGLEIIMPDQDDSNALRRLPFAF